MHDYLMPRQFDWLGLGEMTHSQWRLPSPDATVEELAAFELEKEAANRRFGAVRTVLGMRGVRAPKGQGNNPTGLFWRESTFDFVEAHTPLGVGRTPPTDVVLRLRNGPRREIVTESWHDSYCSRNTRMEEADTRTGLADKVKIKLGADPELRGKAFLGAGDFNDEPMPVGETIQPIDWNSSEITDTSHRWHRAIPQPDGSWVSQTYTDRALSECGMWDPARYAARVHGQISALDPTSGYGPNAVGQGHPQRIIRFVMDPWLVQSVLEVNVIAMDKITDHRMVEVIVAERKFSEGLERQYEPLPSWMSVAHSSLRAGQRG